MPPPRDRRRERAPHLAYPDRREHLLDAAAELLVRSGTEAVTMEGVAAAAGVSKGTVYYQFENRRDILLQLFRRELQLLSQRSADAFARATTLEELLRIAIGDTFAAAAARRAVLGKLLWLAKQDRDLRALRTEWDRQSEQRYVELAVREFGVKRGDAEIAASILRAGTEGAIERWIEYGDDPRHVEEVYVSLALGAARALAAASGTTVATPTRGGRLVRPPSDRSARATAKADKRGVRDR